MADQWRAAIREVAGTPVAMVEINITRTIFIDANLWGQVEQILERKPDGDDNREGEAAGLSGLTKFWKLASTLPPEAMPYFSVPWSNADAHRVGAKPLAEIQSLTDGSSYFRIEGSARDGFVGVLNFGGQDRRIDLSEAGIPVFLASLDETEQKASDDAQAQKISPQDAQKIKDFCDKMRVPTKQCIDEFTRLREWEMERDKKHKEWLEQQMRDREILNSRETYRGDFGAGFGDRYKDTA